MAHHEEVADLMAKNAQLREALTAAQWGFNHVRCPLCAGWMMGPYGETDMMHTPDCIIAVALTRIAGQQSSNPATDDLTVPLAIELSDLQARYAMIEGMVKDLLDAVRHFYGTDGVRKVADQMMRANRARENNAEIDALEKALASQET